MKTAQWKHQPNEALEQQSYAQTRRQNGRPEGRVSFLRIKRPKKRPECQRDSAGKHHIRYLHACEQKKSHARPNTNTCVESRLLSECPGSEYRCEKSQQN